MDIEWHELQAYKREIDTLQKELDNFAKDKMAPENLTHFRMSISNRGHLVIIGLCSLVESFLYKLAIEEQISQDFKLADIAGTGLNRSQKYLSRAGIIDFGPLIGWAKFSDIYKLRNILIHSHGGLIETTVYEKTKSIMNNLNIDPSSSIIGKVRVRIYLQDVLEIHRNVELLIDALQKSI